MTQFETFSTAGLDPRRKLEYWNDFVSDHGSPIFSAPMDEWSFNASVVNATIGDLRIAEVYSDPQIASHTQAHVARTRDPLFFLHMQLTGSCRIRQDSRETVLQACDFALCDTTRPYDLIFDESNRSLVLAIPQDIMRRYLSSPESVVAIGMPGNIGMNGLASEFLRSFWRQLRHQLDATMAPRALHTALDMFAGAYGNMQQSQVPRSSRSAVQRARILNFIEAHLGDPTLTPTAVARACNITARYLHHLFADESETIARHILRRRLEECSKALVASSQRGRSITAIAFDHGFNSATHFGRAFREQFGVTPREYRRGAVQTAEKA